MIEIPLTQGFVAIIDDADVPLVSGYSWRAHVRPHTVYARTSVPRIADRQRGRQATIYLHHLIAGKGSDHRNGDGLDNRRVNLRPATAAENARNRRSNRGSSSPYKGVSWISSKGHWRASLRVGGRLFYLGQYDNPADAARAYDAAARSAFGEFARPNFPEVSL